MSDEIEVLLYGPGSGFLGVIERWKEKSPAEQETARARIPEIRKNMLDAPESHIDSVWRQRLWLSNETARYVAKQLNLENDQDAIDALESALLDELISDEWLAWRNAFHHITTALQDPVIQKNRVVLELLQTIEDEIQDAYGCMGSEYLFLSIREDAAKAAIKAHATSGADGRDAIYAPVRTWVQAAWERHCKEARESGKKPNKTEFANEYAKLALVHFPGLRKLKKPLTTATIKREWLPKHGGDPQ